MANYTITRHLESGHTYGCTNFSTTQEEGQVANSIPGSPLDGTVEWDIKANTGYSVSIDDFLFPYATQVASTDPSLTRWGYLAAPVRGAQMLQVSSTLVRVTLYLTQVSWQAGSTTFTMPDFDVNAVIDIEGCARLAGEPVHINVNKPMNSRTTTQVVVNPKLSNNIVSNVLSATREGFHGTLPATKVDDDSGEQYISSYSVSAEKGYRYSSTPTLNFDSKAYRVDRFVTKTYNEFDPKKQDITSVRFDIYKK